MQNVKVIEPSFLNDDIIGRIEVFARRNNIDYTRRIAEKKKSELEEQRRKEQEAKSKIEEKTIENIDIDTKGIVQKIKDNKPKDMNF